MAEHDAVAADVTEATARMDNRGNSILQETRLLNAIGEKRRGDHETHMVLITKMKYYENGLWSRVPADRMLIRYSTFRCLPYETYI